MLSMSESSILVITIPQNLWTIVEGEPSKNQLIDPGKTVKKLCGQLSKSSGCIPRHILEYT